MEGNVDRNEERLHRGYYTWIGLEGVHKTSTYGIWKEEKEFNVSKSMDAENRDMYVIARLKYQHVLGKYG